jgi:broad specificity phosphatase PhoE
MRKVMLVGGASATGKSTLCDVLAGDGTWRKCKMIWSVLEAAFESGVAYEHISENWNLLKHAGSRKFTAQIKEHDAVISDLHFAIQINLDSALALDRDVEEDIDEPYVAGLGEPFASEIAAAADEVYMVLLHSPPEELLARRKARVARGIRVRSVHPASILREQYFERQMFLAAYEKMRSIRSGHTEMYTIDTSARLVQDMRTAASTIVRKKVLLCRHGETDWNRDEKFMGRANIGLNDVGLAQAERVAEELKGYYLPAIYHSPLLRAKQLAEVIGRYHMEGKLIEVPDLIERDFGEWEGKSIAQVLAEGHEQDLRDETYAPPGGESLVSVRARVRRFTDMIETVATSAVVCSHFSPLTYLVSDLDGVGAAVVSRDTFRPGAYRVVHR